MPVEFHRSVPILRIFDIAKAKEFYLDFLGFRLDWEHRFEPELPLYMQISRGNLVIHFSEHHGDGTPGTAVLVEMKGLREFHREISARRYRNLRPRIERMPWNAEVMGVIDPFGNNLRFTEYFANESSKPTRITKRPPKKAGTGSRD
jgi:catechol 2,3-dioxygenase-like lactoylglutathione lyase family enzyme